MPTPMAAFSGMPSSAVPMSTAMPDTVACLSVLGGGASSSTWNGSVPSRLGELLAAQRSVIWSSTT